MRSFKKNCETTYRSGGLRGRLRLTLGFSQKGGVARLVDIESGKKAWNGPALPLGLTLSLVSASASIVLA